MLETIRAHVDQILGVDVDWQKRRTFSCVVAGIIESRTTVASEIGRHVPGDAYEKHKIKQVDRFLHNQSFKIDDVSRGLLRLINPDPNVVLVVALDWTKTGRFETLKSSVVIGSRSIPFQWTCIDKSETRMADAQRQHVQRLKHILPPGIRCRLLFDAGFPESTFIKQLIKLGFEFVIRTGTQPCIQPLRLKKPVYIDLGKCRWKRGRIYDFGLVSFTKRNGVIIRFIAFHDHEMDAPWLLLTNLGCDARTVVDLYGRRFEIEESFKDVKDLRAGLQLKGTRVQSVESLERLLAVTDTAYFLMVIAGLYGEEIRYHRRLQANSVTERRVLALWRVGRALLRKAHLGAIDLLSRLWSLLRALSESLGGAPCPS
jgi:hypothetical protein